jgi:hypothetical protein
MGEQMTSVEKIAWLRGLPGETISPHQLAKAIGGDPYAYNIAAKDGKLDRELIPHMFRGRNLRIFKEPIIQLIEGRRGEHDEIEEG